MAAGALYFFEGRHYIGGVLQWLGGNAEGEKKKQRQNYDFCDFHDGCDWGGGYWKYGEPLLNYLQINILHKL